MKHFGIAPFLEHGLDYIPKTKGNAKAKLTVLQECRRHTSLECSGCHLKEKFIHGKKISEGKKAAKASREIAEVALVVAAEALAAAERVEEALR